MEKLVRFQVAITQQQYEELSKLMAAGGLSRDCDLLNNAITLLKWAAEEKGRGSRIVSVNEIEGSCKELELPFLEAIGAAHNPSYAPTHRHVPVFPAARWRSRPTRRTPTRWR